MNWRQFEAILWLRWRLTKNQFARGGQVNAVVSLVVLVMLAPAALGLGVGGVALGAFLGAKAPAAALLLVWDGVIVVFMIFWLSGLMVEIQRSESIDLTKLMHLPVTLPQVFAFNYVASHFTISLWFTLPAMLGFCVGLTLGAGPALGLMGPVLLSFIFMVTAWTYCLRGWLTGLMINKRRRRAIILWVTIVFVALCQVPNLVFNSPLFKRKIRQASQASTSSARGHSSKRQGGGRPELVLPEGLVEGHLALPPGWPGYSAMALRQNDLLPAVGSIVVSSLIGVLGLMRAYRVTLRFYQGADGEVRAKAVGPIQTGRRGRLLVECRLPWVAEETAALTLATFRSMLRAPEIKMAAIAPVALAAVMVWMYVSRSMHRPPGAAGGFIATLAAGVAMFSLLPTMSNMFGLDRAGFRALVLLPVRRDRVLLAKNLAFFPFAVVAAGLLLVVVKVLVGVSWVACLGGLLRVPLAFLLFGLLGNCISILAPYRLAPGTLQARKLKPIALVAVFVSMLSLPVALAPVLIPPGLQALYWWLGGSSWVPVDVVASVVLLVAAVWLYRGLLPLQGRWLQRREQVILREVTEEVE